MRTLYFLHAEASTLHLLTAYAKAEREHLLPADLRAWARLVAGINKEGGR